jgi:hypothetical protein
MRSRTNSDASKINASRNKKSPNEPEEFAICKKGRKGRGICWRVLNCGSIGAREKEGDDGWHENETREEAGR